MSNSPKKVLAALLACGLLISSAACSPRTAEKADDASAKEEQAEVKKDNPSSEQKQTEDKEEPASPEEPQDTAKDPEESKQPQENDKEGEAEESTDISNQEIADLYKKAVRMILDLATCEPAEIPRKICSDIEFSREIVEINQEFYCETSMDFDKIVEYYSTVFTGEALEWVPATKFLNVDGKLYCCVVGGTSGWSVRDVSVEKIGPNTYQATFFTACGPEEAAKRQSNFEIKKTDAGYRISSIDYCPPWLKK